MVRTYHVLEARTFVAGISRAIRTYPYEYSIRIDGRTTLERAVTASVGEVQNGLRTLGGKCSVPE
jgi:hypothetical protein